MAKIIGNGPLGTPLLGGNSVKGGKTSEKEKTKKGSLDIKQNIFTDALDEADLVVEKKELLEEYNDLKDLGKEFMRNPNSKIFEEYKARVTAFLKQVLKKIYKVETKEGLPRLGQAQKVYINVNKIDKELEEMTIKFISNQKDAINIIKEVEGIQGMLLSLIV